MSGKYSVILCVLYLLCDCVLFLCESCLVELLRPGMVASVEILSLTFRLVISVDGRS